MSACKKSAYLNKLSSNIVYVGRSYSKYECPDSLCAELGSPMRPVDNLEEGLLVIKKKFPKETPVTISFSPGNYEPETILESLEVPKNVVGLISSEGTAKLKNNLMIKNIEKLDIQNIDLVGNIEIIGEGSHKGKVSWKNGKFYGRYNYITKDESIQSFTMEGVEQFVSDDLDGFYDNEILVTGKGVSTIHKVNCSLESKFKGKVDVSDTGTFNRYTDKCTVISGGETTNLFGDGVLYDNEKENKIHHIETDNDSEKEYSIINVNENGKLYLDKKNCSHNGEFSDGSNWYNHHLQDNGLIEYNAESCSFDISGLGGYLSLDGKDNSKIKVNKSKEKIKTSKNSELRPLIKRILNDSCSLDQHVTKTKILTPSHYYENIQNGNTEFLDHDSGLEYSIAGWYCTNNDKSFRNSIEDSITVSCDKDIGYLQKKILNNESTVHTNKINSHYNVCNNGINAIYEGNHNHNSIFKSWDTNMTGNYNLKNISSDESNKPYVESLTLGDSSNFYNKSKSSRINLVAGSNCNGFRHVSLHGESNSCTVEYDQDYEITLHDNNAICFKRELNDNALHDFTGNTHNITQKGGKSLLTIVQNGNSQYKRNNCQLNLKHTSEFNENVKTIEEILDGNSSLSCTEDMSIQESSGTCYSCTTNGNSNTNHKRKNGTYCGQKQLATRQTNDESVQEVHAIGVELNGSFLSKSSKNKTIIGYTNGTNHCGNLDGNSFNLNITNSTMDGNINTKKSTINCKSSLLKGKLHAVQCQSVQSTNSDHITTENDSPITLEDTDKCNIISSTIQSLTSKPHIHTKTNKEEGPCQINLKGVNFIDTPDSQENSSSSCIQTEGIGKTLCEVGSCSSNRTKFVSTISDNNSVSTNTSTIFSRNNHFGIDGTNPSVDGEVLETSVSLITENGSLTSTPENDCQKDNISGIQIIPKNEKDIPSFTLYYSLALPKYDYFVSSSISFKDIIDSYQSKDAKSGCFTATSVRCMTDENGDPMDGMYIMIEGVRTPNDNNALQTDKDGNIIDRNLKDSLYMEKYHITKIDPITKRSVAQLGGNLQYTDGGGTGATTCIPRLIFPIHYALGAWKFLKNGHIEWNYDNSKDSNYKRELRFFTKNS